MADVHVHVTNKTGGEVSLTLDENDERIDYFKRLVKRDELESVRVESPKAAAKPAAKKAAAKPAVAPVTEGDGSEPSSD